MNFFVDSPRSYLSPCHRAAARQSQEEIMSRIASRTRRFATAAGVIAAGGAIAMLAPTAAQADQIGAGYAAANGGQLCTLSQNANYQVRGEGTANSPGVRFLVYRNGVEVFRTPTGTTTGFAWEGRSAYGTFPGAGSYMVCAKNNSTSRVYVSLVRLRTDGEVM
jgi:hypothetical protein